MLFLVTCVYNYGVDEDNFKVVEAGSRLEVVESIVDNPDFWNTFLQDSNLYEPIVRGNMPYYVEGRPVTAEEALTLIDRSSVDGDSRAQLSILPITEILTLPLPSPFPPRTKPS